MTERNTAEQVKTGSGIKGFRDVVYDVSENGLTGRMSVRAGRHTILFFFVDGRAIFAEENRTDICETVLTVLREAGLLDSDAIHEARKQQLHEVKSLLQILLENNDVSLYTYSYTVGILLRLSILRVLSGPSFAVLFEPMNIRPMKGAMPVDYDEVRKYITIAERYEKTVKRFAGRFFRSVRAPADSRHLEKGRSLFQEMLASSSGPYETIEVLLRDLHAHRPKFEAAVSLRHLGTTAVAGLVRLLLLTVTLLLLWSARNAIQKRDTVSAAGESYRTFVVYRIDLRKRAYKFRTGAPADADRLLRLGEISVDEHKIYLQQRIQNKEE